MNNRFPPGKVPWEKIAGTVSAELPPEVILGPAHGEDAALVKIGDEIWAVASDPITFTAKEAGKLSVIINANDVAVRGAKPLYYSAVVLLSPESSDENAVKNLLDEIRGTCEKMGISLIGGHTEVSPGLPHTIISGTMLGKAIGRPITTGGLREGDLVGLTKWAGLEGTSILFNDFRDELHKIHGSDAFSEAEEVLNRDWLSIVPEAAAAASCLHVSAMHDVTEGGIGEALHEMAVASGLDIMIDVERVPLLAETKLLCSYFGMNSLGLIGSGGLLIGCAKEGKEELEAALSGHEFPFNWIGEAKSATGAPSSTIPRFERDEILKAWLLEGMEACVFDMDGTLVDSEYDWLAIRETLGVDGGSIVDHLNSLDGKEKEDKWAELRRIEREASEKASIKSGVSDLLDLFQGKGIRTALVTNNSDENVAYLLEKFNLDFDAVISRDSGLHKPSGAPVAEAVRRIGADPKRTLCVGDSAYDILACRDAGCAWVCILYDDKGRYISQADLRFPNIEGFIRYLRLVFL